MADLDVTLGLNYQQFRQALARAKNEGKRGADDISRAMARVGNLARFYTGGEILMRGFRFASDAVKAFAKDNADAQAVLAKWDRAGDGIQKGIGEDLVALLDNLSPVLDGLAKLDEYRKRLVNNIADGFNALSGGVDSGETASGVDQARAAARQAAEDDARRRALRAASLKFGADANDASGRTREAAMFREEIRHEAEKKRIGQIADQQQQQAERDFETSLHTMKLADIEREAREGARKFEEHKRELEAEQQLSSLRLNRREREAAVLEAQLKFVKEIAEVENDRSLSPGEKNNRLASLRGLQDSAGRQAALEFDVKSDRERQAALRGLGFDASRGRIDVLRTRGEQELADLAQLRLDTEEKIAAIRQDAVDQKITEADADEAINRALVTRDDILRESLKRDVKDVTRAIRKHAQGDSFREVEAGFGGSIVGSALSFKTGSADYQEESVRLQERLEKLTEENTRLLGSIAENTRSGTGAVFR